MQFIFVPGPYDLSAPKILPRPPLPKYIIEDFIKVVPGTHLATNPCRIQYCTKEIVVFKENMLSKLCRNTLSYPKQEKDENNEVKGEQVHDAVSIVTFLQFNKKLNLFLKFIFFLSVCSIDSSTVTFDTTAIFCYSCILET